MPTPDRNAGGDPGDWATNSGSGCRALGALMLIAGLVSAAQAAGWLTMIAGALT